MNGLQQTHVTTHLRMNHVHNTYLRNTIMVVSLVIFSGIILGPRVDQFVIGTPWLADSILMTQLRRHNWEVKTLQQCV